MLPWARHIHALRYTAQRQGCRVRQCARRPRWGWNQYNWPRFLELLETKALDKANTKGFYRTRNLFYVSISRPRIRLAVLATRTLSATALAAATRLFGEDQVEGLTLDKIG